ncbi:MAG TPA: MBL fold metallo-hydrolase, partial [Tepidisphaeraceae bacterium]|nr:MBL fold metallo-hydrolase [Tepidisphaeraceae bacterium]
ILAGLLLAPIVIFALIGGFLKIAFTLLWPSFAGFWANLSALPIAAMRHTVGWLAKFPAADIPLPAPPVWAILLFYAFLLSLLVPWPRRWMRWSARAVAILGCITLAILPLREGFLAARSDANDLKITLLAIGAGQTCVVEPPGAQALLVDAGSDSLSDVLRKALGPFLRHEGRREVRTIFISHPNYDHFSAVADVAQAYDVSDVWVSPQFRQQSIGNLPAEHLLQTLDNLDRSPHTVSVGQNFDLGGGAKMEVLWPPADSAFDANNCGEVMRLTFAGRTVLFTADIQVPAEKQLLKSPQLLHADVMVAPHHGSFESSTVAFVNAVSPQFIVCSNDRTLSGKQRDFDRATRGRAVYRTHLCGAITIRISKDGKISIERFLNTPDL